MVIEISGEIKKIIEVAKSVADVERVYIFGSHAYGTPNSESDVDLCIITKDSINNKRDFLKKVRKLMAPTVKVPVDLLIYSNDEFFKRSQIKSTLEYKIAREGIKIYG
ncbi:nucleotidyltransferase domain-containing protein [Carboxydothermus pertinax]|uniref:Nucleotidyltransferase n=1 Tax=Carboxydothermus pertinax TaxID=870242 RepID=A0A1L8CX04_9THEO|nr:nucleotidyltransferase domain-containing protein [Carboxydothermus pertinax]GAV23394.1 nucleotidyltransferase [Carboxydothermus pertinax]